MPMCTPTPLVALRDLVSLPLNPLTMRAMPLPSSTDMIGRVDLSRSAKTDSQAVVPASADAAAASVDAVALEVVLASVVVEASQDAAALAVDSAVATVVPLPLAVVASMPAVLLLLLLLRLPRTLSPTLLPPAARRALLSTCAT